MHRTYLIGGFILLAGLGGGLYAIMQANQQTAGPCVHRTMGEPLQITNATDAQTGDPIETITVRNITHQRTGAPFSSQNDCGIPCSLDIPPGNYTMTVAADGYQSATIDAEAMYHSFEGGCPSSASNGTTTTITLQPAGD